jgi:uncharacterized protein (DUF362 family)
MRNERTVSLVKGDDRRLNIINALKLIQHDLAEIEEKEIILIKPNLTSPTNPFANTDVESVKAVIDFINQSFGGKEFLIVEGSGGGFLRGINTKKVFERFGYYRLKNRWIEVKSVEECEDFFEIPVKTVDGEKRVRIAELDVDYVISLALPKTHDFAIATLGIKNMMGLIKQEDKVMIHGYRHLPGKLERLYFLEKFVPKRIKKLVSRTSAYSKSVKLIHHNLLSLAKSSIPDLVILDGYYCMEGDGPINGEPVKMNVCIASTDALKADGIGVRIMGLEPEEIGYLYYAAHEGLGDYSTDGLLGEKIEKVRKTFRMHSTYEIQRKWGK